MSKLSEMNIDDLCRVVEENSARVAEQGAWPESKIPRRMARNIPRGDMIALGLDAGIACALDLIPRDKQTLAAGLCGEFTSERVKQVRREVILSFDLSEPLDPDCESAWWLAAFSLYSRKGVNEDTFRRQLVAFEGMAKNLDNRLEAIYKACIDIMESFQVLGDGTPFSIEPYGLQCAYLDGHSWAVQYYSGCSAFFIGTFHSSLGLEDFAWSEHKDAIGDAVSGPVHGSQQLVMCSTPEELAAALAIVRKHFAG